jgi:Cu(I)/Ag(I) efflux system periplasmic protein CusF
VKEILMSRRLIKPIAALLGALVATAALSQTPDVDGEVRKVDKAQQKVTLKHGAIKNIDMPAMTMVFRVKDAKMLDSLAEGDKVKFSAEKINGQYTITAISK